MKSLKKFLSSFRYSKSKRKRTRGKKQKNSLKRLALNAYLCASINFCEKTTNYPFGSRYSDFCLPVLFRQNCCNKGSLIN